MELEKQRIQKGLPQVKVKVFDAIDSTNTEAKRELSNVNDQQTPVPGLIVANQQTAGYGRSNREFYSPADVGIYMTMLAPVTQQKLVQPGTLTLNLAVAVQQTIAQQLGITLSIKWVNDLYLQQRKVVGILVEMPQLPTATTDGVAIMGMGINLNTVDLPENIEHKAGALTTKKVDREALIIALYQACMQAIQQDFSELRNEYLAHSLVLQRSVTLQRGPQKIQGRVVDIDEQGRLVLEMQGGTYQAFSAGEITKVNLE